MKLGFQALKSSHAQIFAARHGAPGEQFVAARLHALCLERVHLPLQPLLLRRLRLIGQPLDEGHRSQGRRAPEVEVRLT